MQEVLLLSKSAFPSAEPNSIDSNNKFILPQEVCLRSLLSDKKGNPTNNPTTSTSNSSHNTISSVTSTKVENIAPNTSSTHVFNKYSLMQLLSKILNPLLL
jgi:hypothetical protein